MPQHLRNVARRARVAGALALAASVTASCATYSDKTEEARAALLRGDYEGSVKQLDKILKVRSFDEMPSEWKKNFALVVLERAMVLQAMREYSSSAKNFIAADKELELLDIARDGAGKLGKYVYSDSATKYKTSPVEKLSLNAMNMINYLVRGDLSGAKVEAKRFTVMRTYMRDYKPDVEHGAFGSYLAGFVNERLGNADEALRYYDEALQERDFGSLREPIERLAARGSYRGERIKDYLPTGGTGAATKPEPEPPPVQKPAVKVEPEAPPPASDSPPEPEPPPVQSPAPPTGVLSSPVAGTSPWVVAAPGRTPTEILVVAKTGRVPYKVPERIPIGAAIGLAGAYVTGDTTLLEYGMFKVVVYPELAKPNNMFVDAELRVDGTLVAMDEATNLGGEIIAEYEEIKPKIIGAALTRMIVRAAAAEGARAGGNAAAEDSGAAGLVGFLAAAAIEGTLVALDKPDTRSWSTLPDRVHIGRAVVPPGAHTVEVTVFGPGGKERHTTEVQVQEGGFTVVDVTTLR
ncbi:MAG: hypothetical protein AB1Z98_04435 [Nannocystaceae bacterium]